MSHPKTFILYQKAANIKPKPMPRLFKHLWKFLQIIMEKINNNYVLGYISLPHIRSSRCFISLPESVPIDQEHHLFFDVWNQINPSYCHKKSKVSQRECANMKLFKTYIRNDARIHTQINENTSNTSCSKKLCNK